MRFALVIAIALMPFVPLAPAQALPQHPTCRITTYYNDAAHDKVVGTRTVCPGSPTHVTGRTSKYFETETVTLDQGPGGGHGNGPGGLPCEFLQAGCSNLPVQRN